jgi:hypothetical protein
VTATDGSGAQASGSFMLTVANTNDAPTLATPIADQSASEASLFTFTLPANTFADVDQGDIVTYSATRTDGTALPAWLRFDAATLVFRGTPQRQDAGPLEIRVSATDRAGQSASDRFRVMVFAQPFLSPAPATPSVPAQAVSAPAPASAPVPAPSAIAPAAPPASPAPEPMQARAPVADPMSASLPAGGNAASPSPTTPAPSAGPVAAPSNAPAAAPAPATTGQPAAAAPATAKAQESPKDASPPPAAAGDARKAALSAPAAEAAVAATSPGTAGGPGGPSGQAPGRAESPSPAPGAAAVATLGRWVAGSGFGGSLMAPAPVQPSLSWAPIAQLGLERGAFDSALGVGSSSSGDGTASQRVDNSFRQLREDALEEAVVEQSVVASSVVISTGFSFGYVLWLARGGALLASLASAIPAWAMVDPLPVLSKQRPGAGRDPNAQDPDPGADNDGMPGPHNDEVEDMFGAGSRAATKPRTPPQPVPPQTGAAPQPTAEPGP